MEKANQLLTAALAELKYLRARNQEMGLRLEMLDDIKRLLNINLNRGMQHTPDLAGEIEGFLREEKAKVKPAAGAEAQPTTNA